MAGVEGDRDRWPTAVQLKRAFLGPEREKPNEQTKGEGADIEPFSSTIGNIANGKEKDIEKGVR